MSIRRQCELLGVNRSSVYYVAHPACTDEDVALMNAIDEIYTEEPSFGYRRICAALKNWKDQHVNHKRVSRLMRVMGIEAIYRKPRLSKPNPEHRVFPYLLRNVPVVRPNQVWATDITYIRMGRGFAYLVAILDWFSRYVVSWRVSNSVDTAFCLEALDDALSLGERPETFNSDQGCQFTSSAFTGRLLDADIKISMDGRGRVFDNIFVERLWRTVKHEHIYLHDYGTITALIQGLTTYFWRYNNRRPHQSLEYATPADVYFGKASAPAVAGRR